MPSPAPAAGVPIEGKLLVVGWTEAEAPFSYFMDGASDVVVASPTIFDVGDISPDTTKMAYATRTSGGWFLADTGEIWVSSLDGSDAVNLTSLAGMGGVNCLPTWSPDGRMIAFQHSAPAAGQATCEAGFRIWLMGADGTGPHQWNPPVSYSLVYLPTWEPDGYRIRAATTGGGGYFSADVTGENVVELPGVDGGQAAWSRDGSPVAYVSMLSDTVSGESGVWRGICLADADGSNPQMLVQQFIKDSDITAYISKYDPQPADTDWFTVIRSTVGPSWAKWSPMGDQLVFTAALPFDPNGAEFTHQVEVWLYDLTTEQRTRLTSNTDQDAWLSWAGPNTTSTHSTVTVNNTSVTFPDVLQDGWTSITRTEDLPALPESYFRLDNFYQITSTAQVTGPATVAMSYGDDAVAATVESHVAILRYDEATAQWEDITTSRDADLNIVTGQTDPLGLMGLAYSLPPSNFSDVSSDQADPYWALWEIEAAYAAGIVQGSGGYYFPTNPVTRDQLAVYIARAMNGGDPTGPATVTFTDITNPWANVHIAYCVANNVVRGFDATHYGPTLEVDRGSMAVFIARAKGWVSIDDAMDTAPELFTDVPAGYWSGTAIKACLDHGVVKGYDATHYQPTWIVSRDQMAVFVTRAFNLPM
jgi:Tol biopolymer transport system component